MESNDCIIAALTFESDVYNEDVCQRVRDTVNEVLCEMITLIVSKPGMVNGILATIPEDWQYDEMLGGDHPTKRDIAWWYLWEILTTGADGSSPAFIG